MHVYVCLSLQAMVLWKTIHVKLAIDTTNGRGLLSNEACQEE